jgi:hypothetical protein
MADIKQVSRWLKDLQPDQKIRRPDWREFKYIYLHIYGDKTTAIGMCKHPGQVDWGLIELYANDITADDWQLIEE